MGSRTWSEVLWGKNAKVIYLLLAATVLLLTMLGSREIWTQEHRWADIVSGMFYRHDFLHPYLGESDYYDKPLLSYWLIAGLSYVTGQFSMWAMRLPSALAGLLAVWSIYRIGTIIKDKRLGLMSGWILLTTFYFLFWAKTSSADMLNLGGTLFAVCWYFEKKEKPGFGNYAVFFMILALTSLCKGLVGAIVPLMVIFPDLMMKQEWKKHLRLRFFLAMIPAAIVYVLPFWASSYFGGNNYGENGLYLVYRENILRYFQPFDHKGPIYTYFLYLPIYLLPWALFFIPSLFSLKSRWSQMSDGMKSMCWAVLMLFLFFTFSGSRRNYYVLPLVPFAILMTADWILSGADQMAKRYVWAGRVAISFFLIFFLSFDVAQPLYYAQGGMTGFAAKLKQEVGGVKPLSDWQFVMLDPESKARFYLELSPGVKNYSVVGKRETQTEATLSAAWPMLSERQPNVIFISRKMYEPMLKNLLPNYTEIEAPATFGERLMHKKNQNAPIAFVPPSAV
jgi:4-amino-4-deoxy-L-arabinose transferase-like glycosyltransferase